MQYPIPIREAMPSDRERLYPLLASAHLSTDAVLVEGTRYWLAEDSDRQVVGIVGLEYGAQAVLLRSAVVSPALRGQGIAAALVELALESAASAGYSCAYLFSTGAGPYWIRRGFYEVPVPELVAALPAAPQVLRFEAMGWLPTEVAWRKDLSQGKR